MKAVLAYLAGRAREPSTWAGISMISVLFGISIPADAGVHVGAIIDATAAIVDSGYKIVAAGAALYAIFRPDRSAGLAR